MIDLFDNALPYINMLMGMVFTLTGFKIHKPFSKEKEEMIYKKYGNLFKYGGIAMIVFGVTDALT